MSDKIIQLNYTERFIAFLDVIGFRYIVSESDKKIGKKQEVIKRVSEAILYSISEIEEILGSESNLIYTHFSDSFVISIPVNEKLHDAYKFSLLISTVVYEFLRSNIFLRGGITRGQLIHNDKLLFGPAMNRAYELESHVAKYPRIIIDPNLIETEPINMLNPHEIYGYKESNCLVPHVYLAKDDDGLLYINYFEPDKAFFLKPGWLLAIQETIEAIPLTTELHEKRSWLVKKYNEAILKFSYDEFKDRLGVKASDDSCVDKYYEELLGDAKQLHKII